MIARKQQQRIAAALDAQAGAMLLGPRQVGKTTLALELVEARQAVYLDMERPGDRQILDEPDLYLDSQAGRLVVIDEVQRVPGLFRSLRGQIDRRRRRGDRTGQFLLLGSASNALLRQTAESLAGRVSYHELAPFTLDEVERAGADEAAPAGEAAPARWMRLWLRGGFPDSFLAGSDRLSLTWRQDLIRTFLERDLPSFGLRVPPRRCAGSGPCWRTGRAGC